MKTFIVYDLDSKRFRRALKRFGVASFILDISLPTELSKALSSGNLRDVRRG